MANQKKPAKIRLIRNKKTKQALADVEKALESSKKLELELKRVKKDIQSVPHHPSYGGSCTVYGTQCKP